MRRGQTLREFVPEIFEKWDREALREALRKECKARKAERKRRKEAEAEVRVLADQLNKRTKSRQA